MVTADRVEWRRRAGTLSGGKSIGEHAVRGGCRYSLMAYVAIVLSDHAEIAEYFARPC